MANNNHESGALWDWDSVLLLTHSVDSPETHEFLVATEDTPQQRRRRDPRLSCPNYLAGRVPCACSDEEDKEEDRLHKRSKLSAHCQVPNCESDLSQLKGYHQKHRVCLSCANATSVFLHNRNHRYCQQCGKFHPVADFDGDKRSCRRKLERHNNRRRRKLPDESALNEQSQLPVSTTNNSDASASDAQPEIPPESSAAPHYSLEHHLVGKDPEPAAVRENSIAPPDTSATGEQSLLALLLDEQTGDEHIRHPKENDKHLGPSVSSSTIRKPSSYTSPCPTKRISFKFYDWNPADFPRRLREQILEWLSNMPVELEGYIRSGCTILTLFIAMPDTVWLRLHKDWNGCLVKLIRAADSGFWDKGLTTAYFDNKIAYIDNGIVSSPSLEETTERYPMIEAAYPICLEAGTKANVTVLGHNLLELNGRLLIGSEGKYLPYYASNLASSLQVDIVTPQRFGIAFIEVAYDYGMSNFVPLLIADKEVCKEVRKFEQDMAIPKQCCCPDGSGRCLDMQRQQEAHDLLIDLGWVVKQAQGIGKALVTDVDVERLQRLLIFAAKQGWCVIATRVLQVANAFHILEHAGIDNALELAAEPDIIKILLAFQAQCETKSQKTEEVGDSYWTSYYPYLCGLLRAKKGCVIKAALGLTAACVGVCIVLKHPLVLSRSLRRCLWYKPLI